MDQDTGNTGQSLGIAGLVLGILAIPLGIIPCTFILGLVLGVTGIVFGAVGYTQAQKTKSSTSLPLGALTVSIVGTCIALLWTPLLVPRHTFDFHNLQKNIHKIEKKSKELDNLNNVFDSFDSELEEVLIELEDSLNIKIDSQLNQSLKGLSDEEKAKKIGKAAGKAVKEFLKEVSDTTKSK